MRLSKQELLRRSNAAIYLLISLDEKKDERHDVYADKVEGIFDIARAYKEELNLARRIGDKSVVNFLKGYPTGMSSKKGFARLKRRKIFTDL